MNINYNMHAADKKNPELEEKMELQINTVAIYTMSGPSPHQDIIQNTQFAALVWLAVAIVIAVLLYLTYFFTRGKKKKERNVPVRVNPQANVPVAGGRRPRRMRVRREEDEDAGGFDDSDDEGPPLIDDKGEGKIGAKKQRKLEMKAEKRAERQAELEEREERKKREATLAAERKKDEEAKQKEQAVLAEIERQRKEEQERKEHEEYLKLKEEFTIEESGEVGILSEEESQSLLQEFVNYVKESKVILLEDLASHFGLKTQEAIDRLENLQEMGRITGVMDDRGKFIYISEDELQNVAKFIRQRGRIAISELAESSNSFIMLQEGKTQDNIPKNVEVSA